MPTYSQSQRVTQKAAAVVFLSAGVGHFLAPSPLVRMIPPYLPSPLALVLISGVVELAGGAGLLWARFRRPASLLLAALLVSILPANIFMLVDPVAAGVSQVPAVLLWGRILALPLMIWCLVWSTRPAR